jgi:deaminated glutathione amidase
MSRIGVVALQLELRAEDNLDRIVAEIEAAKRRLPWGELFVLPELCTYGPSLRNAQPPGSRTESVYRDVARRLGIWLVPGSLLEQRGEAVHNVALVIDPQGEVVGRYAKLFPFLPYEGGSRAAIRSAPSASPKPDVSGCPSATTSGSRRRAERSHGSGQRSSWPRP